MCRHFAYLGPPVRLADLVIAPPHGLLQQSWAPRRQRNGLLNADGFGVGWYPHPGAEPLRYRRCVPIWTDADFPTTARGITADAVLGAVRSATGGNPVAEAATAPFAHGTRLFSHNGALPGWPESAAELAADLPWSALARQQVLLDSTLLWALYLHLLDTGLDEVSAFAEVTRRARRIPGARVNLLLHDGNRILATAAGDSLCYLQGGHPDPAGALQPGVIVASEPFDDSDAWVDVPEDHLLVATRTHVTVRHLADVTPEAAARDELLLEAP
ncbi:MAG TPA: ergothioneine biosynthesis protein EgtC [Sporichthyaceae bacterium]|jgi:glutamine amidotransferase|nr:ergothioneine biosynthesis protein EgtC [Sporichthyaceae bacterium]